MTRGDKAKEYFLSGYNCAQAVALAFGDIIEMDSSTIATLTSGFGGGIGRMREVCGSISGATFVLSALYGYDDPKDIDSKKDLYKIIQQLGTEFKNQNGSVVCRELLSLDSKGFDNPTPSERNEKYYKKRPCHELVKCSADILEQIINEK